MKPIFIILSILSGCIISPDHPIKLPTPIPVNTPSPAPVSVSTSAPVVTPTPMGSSNYEAIVPIDVNIGESFIVYLKANKDDDVKIYADKIYFISPMLWDDRIEQKYMSISLHSTGSRTIDFKVNGSWKVSKDIYVK